MSEVFPYSARLKGCLTFESVPMNVADILEQRKNPSVCTSEVWAARRAEEEKRKAERAADNIANLLADANRKVDELVEQLRDIRLQENLIKTQLNAVGVPLLYAEDGLNRTEIKVEQLGPLVEFHGHNMADYGLPEDTLTEVPEDFQPEK